jgi:8-oxo-dGTP pyrophosphatase MutT (NUDIX family)
VRTPESLAQALAETSPLRLDIPEFAAAAVLVPVIAGSPEPTLLYTQRPQDMPTHAGQISFPGGRWEPTDADARATALREAQEELGIEPSQVQVLGELDDVATPVGFVITPVVGWLESLPELKPDPREVDEYFEVSIDDLNDPAHFRDQGVREIAGKTYQTPEYRVADRLIWGATARMTQRLLEVLGPLGLPSLQP